MDLLLAAYLLVFGLSAGVCFGSLFRVSKIQNTDVRHGLAALLGTSGSWAAAHVGYLLAPSELLKLGFYLLGLTAGFAAVGAWLYFCSAYTDRTYHRRRPYQYLAVAVFGGVVLFKLTNPVHSLYFTTELVSEPFSHLAVTHGLAHWIAMALAYSLASVGFFMLFERFVTVGFDTRPLAVLAGITGLPVLFDILGLVSPRLIDMTYEPVGVAIFSVGVLFVYFEHFQAVSLAGEADVPVIFLNGADEIRDWNRQAEELFPSLAGGVGDPVGAVAPELAEALDAENQVIERGQGTMTRYYLVSRTPFTAGDAELGQILTLTDRTEEEQYRRELERKTDTLEQFASVVSHDLRNPLNVASLRLDLAAEECNSEHLDDVERALARMEALIEDLLTLAREGQSVDDLQEVDLATEANRCWQGVDTVDAELVVEDHRTLVADPSRLQQLFENLFRNAVDHGGPDVTVTVGTVPNGFYVADTGPGIPAEHRDAVFEFGYSTAEDDTGFGLAIVDEIVEGHGWEISLTEGPTGGARFEITGVDRTA